jgi:hypothetical protein
MRMTPIFFLRYSNVCLGRGFINMFDISSLVGTYSNLTTLSFTCSLKNWYLIGICFIFECITGFFEMLIALVLSLSIEIGFLCSILMSCSVSFIHRICVQQVVVSMYSSSVVDNEIEDCFLLSQDTKWSPKKNAPPLVLFLSSTLLAQSASVYVVRVKYSPFGYHNPNSKVPFKYLNIRLTAYTCVSLGAAWNLPNRPTACIIYGLEGVT